MDKANPIIPANIDISALDDISEDWSQMIGGIDITSEEYPMLADIAEDFPVVTGEISSLHSICMFLQNRNDDITSSKDSASHAGTNSSLKRVPPGLLSPARMTPLRSVRPARLL
jgi:hypothetical protein